MSSLRAALSLLVAGATCGLALAAFAQFSDVAGEDHPLVTRPPGAVLIGYLAKEWDRFLYVDEALAEDLSNPIQDHLRWMEGPHWRLLYLSGEDHTSAEVDAVMRADLEARGFNEIFACIDQDCGDPRALASAIMYGTGRRLFDLGPITERAFHWPKEVHYAVYENAEARVFLLSAREAGTQFPDTQNKTLTLVDVVGLEG